MNDAVIVDAVRSPMGRARPDGALAAVHPVELLAQGSGQQAVQFAAQGVMAGGYDLVIAAGVESMSRVPMGSNRQGADIHGPSVSDRYAPGLVPQAVCEAGGMANALILERDRPGRHILKGPPWTISPTREPAPSCGARCGS
ncbi:MAG: hypothetical protein ACRDNL_12780 [Spirillospora sp.]